MRLVFPALLVVACAPSEGSLDLGVESEPTSPVIEQQPDSTAEPSPVGWESSCPEPSHRAGCTVTGTVTGALSYTFVQRFDDQGREVLWEESLDGDGWELRIETEWDGETRIATQEVPGLGLIRTEVAVYRDDGQVFSSLLADHLEDVETGRALTYDPVGRVVSEERTRGALRVESCASTWTEAADAWEQTERCESAGGNTIAVTVWDVERRVPLEVVWDRDGDGIEEWTAFTEYRDDCQVRRDEQVLPPSEGYDRFVTEHTIDASDRVVRTVVTALDDDGDEPPTVTTTDLAWSCP